MSRLKAQAILIILSLGEVKPTSLSGRGKNSIINLFFIWNLQIKVDKDAWQKDVEKGMEIIEKQYPGLTLKKSKGGWEVLIPEKSKGGS